VANLGWHTGIIISSQEFQRRSKLKLPDLVNSNFVEFGWGDREFYQSSRYSSAAAIKAALFSSGSVVHVVQINQPALYFSRLDVIELGLSSDQLDSLVTYISSSFASQPAGELRALGLALYGQGHFYEATGSFSLARTCNSWTAEALIKAGCLNESSLIQRSSTLMRRLRYLQK
jgi:uncharacterized protein (TIGR02117 family)